ncbi:hypothetical protein Pmani_001293 [Petrolisthes manimaculis]|uniref:Uncharacterized protein n=1 Tax=Petrolisthes manimaculis TaxID=1843537 RepID=A0AAE1URQ7_9EUCA|nr:hypothetical protein Pmani_001293 [Petrolisthes manimaculis]
MPITTPSSPKLYSPVAASPLPSPVVYQPLISCPDTGPSAADPVLGAPSALGAPIYYSSSTFLQQELLDLTTNTNYSDDAKPQTTSAIALTPKEYAASVSTQATNIAVYPVQTHPLDLSIKFPAEVPTRDGASVPNATEGGTTSWPQQAAGCSSMQSKEYEVKEPVDGSPPVDDIFRPWLGLDLDLTEHQIATNASYLTESMHQLRVIDMSRLEDPCDCAPPTSVDRVQATHPPSFIRRRWSGPRPAPRGMKPRCLFLQEDSSFVKKDDELSVAVMDIKSKPQQLIKRTVVTSYGLNPDRDTCLADFIEEIATAPIPKTPSPRRLPLKKRPLSYNSSPQAKRMKLRSSRCLF